eukprot:TRINITY_DN9799_c0_g1_i1.p1 TRINITY_DN9799_c0_g1~~TRINITY_DN9799_c0_g1_i1.p1  ORF type:complete len:368 (-),score=63.45 TRINITY_DN9799_c0_g1_i1:178-1281(-)
MPPQPIAATRRQKAETNLACPPPLDEPACRPRDPWCRAPDSVPDDGVSRPDALHLGALLPTPWSCNLAVASAVQACSTEISPVIRGSGGTAPAPSASSASTGAAHASSQVTELTSDNLATVLGTALAAIVELYPITAAAHNAAIDPLLAASEEAAPHEAAAAADLVEAARFLNHTPVDETVSLPLRNLIAAVKAYTPARLAAAAAAAAVADGYRPLPLEPASFPPANDTVAVFFGDEPTTNVHAFIRRLIDKMCLSPSVAADAMALLGNAARTDGRLTPYAWTVSRLYTVAAWLAVPTETGVSPADGPAWAAIGGFRSHAQFFKAVDVLKSVLGQDVRVSPSARVCMCEELVRYYNEVVAERGLPSG